MFYFIGQPISDRRDSAPSGMGNETSILEQCTIDESPILKSKYWSLHHGQRDEDHTQLSVFVSKQKRVSNDDNILFQSGKVRQIWDAFLFVYSYAVVISHNKQSSYFSEPEIVSTSKYPTVCRLHFCWRWILLVHRKGIAFISGSWPAIAFTSLSWITKHHLCSSISTWCRASLSQ